jgi:ankyrin repeat protein
MHRRTFTLLAPAAALAQTAPPPVPQIGSDLVREWIIKAHQPKPEIMKDLLRREPALIHTAWDWGAGDYETALHAAAHVGNRDMALYLIDQGGRFDLFATTMLGQLPLLKSIVETYPATLQVRGAHQIPLLSHAAAGGAIPTMEYLIGKGADVNAVHKNGVNALILAVQNRKRDVVQLLLAKGAAVNYKAPNGTTALALAVKAQDSVLVNDLKSAGAKE